LSSATVAQRRSTKPRKGRRERWSPVRLAIVLLLSVAYLYPFAFMIVTALKPEDEYVESPAGWPSSLTLDHIRGAWNESNPQLGTALVNSAIAVSIGVVVCCALTSLAAFYLVRRRNAFTNVILAIFGSLFLIPIVIWLVPFFILLSDIGLTDNIVVLGIVYGTVFAPSFIWLLWAYFLQSIPHEVLEAAEVDGANLWQQYRRIVLPLSLPALGAVAALTFIFSWGDILLVVVLIQDPSNYTVVPAAAALVGRFNANVQLSTAAAVITILPALIVFLLAQKAIVRGITGGFGK